jgi:outer membrane protein assembly factor BamB
MRMGIVALSCLLLMTALAMPASADNTNTTCAVLFDFGNGQVEWSDISLSSGMNALNVTKMAAMEHGLEIEESFGYVSTLNGMGYNATTGEYWNFWTWNSTQEAWDWSMVGPADVNPSLVGTIAWSYATSTDPMSFAPPFPPVATPEHRYPWTSYRHDNLNSGMQASYAPNNVTLNLEKNLNNGAIDAPIVVANGLLYVVTSGVLNLTTHGYDTNSTVYCLNSSGGVVWDQPIGKGYQFASPLIFGDFLIVHSVNGLVYAFDRVTGASQWAFNTDSVELSGSPSPIAYRGQIYVASGNGMLFAIRNNGSQVWNSTVATSIYSSSPAAWNGTIYIGAEDGKIHAFNAEDGIEKWNASIGGMIRGFPLIASSSIVVTYVNGTGGGLAWVSLAGDVLRYVETGASPASPVLTRNGFAFITATDLFMVNPAGQVLWNLSLGTQGTQLSGAAPTSVNGTIFLVTNEAQSRAMAISESGEIYWQMPLSPAQYALSAPTVADGVLYVSSDNGHVYAFDLNSVAPSTAPMTVSIEGKRVNLTAPEAGSSLFEYVWDLGDGNTSTGRTVSHAYAKDGKYNVTLTTTNPAGQSATTSRSVSIDTSTPSGDNTVMMVAALALVALVVAALVFLLRKGK